MTKLTTLLLISSLSVAWGAQHHHGKPNHDSAKRRDRDHGRRLQAKAAAVASSPGVANVVASVQKAAAVAVSAAVSAADGVVDATTSSVVTPKSTGTPIPQVQVATTSSTTSAIRATSSTDDGDAVSAIPTISVATPTFTKASSSVPDTKAVVASPSSTPEASSSAGAIIPDIVTVAQGIVGNVASSISSELGVEIPALGSGASLSLSITLTPITPLFGTPTSSSSSSAIIPLISVFAPVASSVKSAAASALGDPNKALLPPISVSAARSSIASSIAAAAPLIIVPSSSAKPSVVVPSVSVVPSVVLSSSLPTPTLSSTPATPTGEAIGSPSSSSNFSHSSSHSDFVPSVQSIFGQVQTSTLLIAPSSTSVSSSAATRSPLFAVATTSSTSAAATSSSSSAAVAGAAVPSSWPAKIVPPTTAVPSSDDSLASLMLSSAESYEWLLANTDAASQIFAFMPTLVAGALNIPESEVQTVAIVPYTTNGETLAVWTGYIPTADMSELQAMVLNTTSPFYTSGSSLLRQLASEVNPNLPVSAYANTPSTGSNALASDTSASGSSSSSSSTQHTTLVAVTSSFGAVVVLLGTFVTWRARHLRQKAGLQSATGPISIGGPNDLMRQTTRFSTMSGSSNGSTLSSSGSHRDYEFDWANLGHQSTESGVRRTQSTARRIPSGRVSISRPTLQANSLLM